MTTPRNFTDFIAEAQKQAISSLRQANEFSLSAAEAAVGLVPDDPALPFQGRLPRPTEIVEASFEFAGQILALEKEYALRLAEVWSTGAGKAAESATNAADRAPARKAGARS